MNPVDIAGYGIFMLTANLILGYLLKPDLWRMVLVGLIGFGMIIFALIYGEYLNRKHRFC